MQERHETGPERKAVSISSRFTHHNTFPFQWRLSSFCAAHFKISSIKDQLEMACFELTSLLSTFPLLFAAL